MYTHLRHPNPPQTALRRYNKTIRVTDQRVMTIACGRSSTATDDERHSAILKALRSFPPSSVKALGTICMPNWRRGLATLLDAIDERSFSVANRRAIEFARAAMQDDALKPDGVYRPLVAYATSPAGIRE